MKKILSLIFAICLIMPCAVMLSGCSDDYFRKTRVYKFESMSLKCPTQEEKEKILNGETEEEYLREHFTSDTNGLTFTFDTHGYAVFKTLGGFEIEYEYEIEHSDHIEITQYIEGREYVSTLKLTKGKLIQRIYNFGEVSSVSSYIEVVYSL